MSRGAVRRALDDVSDVLDDRALTIYVDGSMYGSPRRGGVGIRFAWANDEGQEELWDHALPATMGATNNQMELEAPSAALRLAIGSRTPFKLGRFDKIVIRTDSEYVDRNLNTARAIWSNNGWTTRSGSAVLNVADWKTLLTLIRRVSREHRLPVHFEWTKGKKGRHTKAVDKLAKQSSNSPAFGRARPNLVTRKTSSEQVDTGSVNVTGQVMTVRIIQAQYLPPPRRSSRYKYEVVEQESPYYQKVAWAESDIALKVGHTYSVRMNQVQENPRIDELQGELEEDLSPYLDALTALGTRSTAKQVTDELTRTNRLSVSPGAVRRRLDHLVELGKAQRVRASSAGRPYLYERE